MPVGATIETPPGKPGLFLIIVRRPIADWLAGWLAGWR